ncbi:MAG: hypothetical protein HY308_14245 [Gammaproteobacteria bacterium]|nr:hypothetical protein [Gammaproteobacteria bacterium]
MKTLGIAVSAAGESWIAARLSMLRIDYFDSRTACDITAYELVLVEEQQGYRISRTIKDILEAAERHTIPVVFFSTRPPLQVVWSPDCELSRDKNGEHLLRCARYRQVVPSLRTKQNTDDETAPTTLVYLGS